MAKSLDEFYGSQGQKKKKDEDVGFFESALAGVATGLWNIPKGVFSLGATLFDLVADANTAKALKNGLMMLIPGTMKLKQEPLEK